MLATDTAFITESARTRVRPCMSRWSPAPSAISRETRSRAPSSSGRWPIADAQSTGGSWRSGNP